MNADYPKLSSSIVEHNFNNPSQIVFETTEKCNLACRYCTFRELYSHHDNRGVDGQRDLNSEDAITLMNYYIERWKRIDCPHNNVYISFYGGEPLLNFNLIKNVVELTQQQKHLIHINPIFTITTNATLLCQHIDFLVENNFQILISLDGDRSGNALRIFAGGQESFSVVIKNIREIRRKYPEFYKRNISFNSVLHQDYNLSSLFDFFEKSLKKRPMFSTINPSSINESYQDEFNSMKVDFNTAIKELSKDNSNKIWNEYMGNNPYVTEITSYIFNESGNVYNDLNSLLLGKSIKPGVFLSGTCLPFAKKVFLTARGLILPCERISHNNSLGVVSHGKILINYAEVANKYNNIYRKLSSQCHLCENNKTCLSCVFQDDTFCLTGKCGSYSSNKRLHSLYKEILFSHPELYAKIMHELVVN